MHESRFYQFAGHEDLYYSPNSAHDVHLPLKSREEDAETNIFLSESKATKIPRFGEISTDVKNARAPIKYNFARLYLSDYQKPRWWTRLWGWTCFIPTKFTFSGILRPLCSAQRPVKAESAEYYSMTAEDISTWARLENDLFQFYLILEKHLLLGHIYPALPQVFGYRRKYRSFSRALQAMEHSRDWFMVWVGLISYAIAKAETEELRRMLHPNLRIASWYEAVIKGGCNPAWLDNLIFSCIYTFDDSVRRTGIFLHPDSQKEDQPPIEWFREYSIPVWFPYNPAISKNPKFIQGLPSATRLRALGSQLCREVEQMDDSVPNWVPFFEARGVEIKRIIDGASKADLDIWNARKRRGSVDLDHEPTVHEWNEGSSGKWVRRKLTKRLAKLALLKYRPSQIHYCPYYDEYDCCEKWGDHEEGIGDTNARNSAQPPEAGITYVENEANFADEDEFADENIAHSQEDFLEGPREEPFMITTRSNREGSFTTFQLDMYPRLSNSLPPHSAPDVEDLIVAEITDVLRLYFGFTGIVPSPPSVVELSTKRTLDFLTILGFKWKLQWHNAICRVPSIQAAETFLKLASGDGRNALLQAAESWDLSSSHREFIVLRRRFKYIRRLELSEGRSLFIFDFGKLATVPWKLAVTKASDSLMVCRLEDAMNEVEVSRFLLNNGIRFRTLLPTKLLSRSPARVFPAVLPLRQEDHIFAANDYGAYQDRLLDFLKNERRARAALMRGGYSWRLSARDVDFKEVEHGPTGWSLIRHEMFIVNDPKTGEELMDDALTPAEEELLCGSYTCITGHRQEAFKSWFPDPHIYERSGNDYGRWTELSEKLYRQIVDKLGSTPIEQPKSSRNWRKALHGKSFLRRALHTIECRSDVVLKESGK